MLELYDNIRKRRRELNMSQDELAKKVGYSSRSMISHVENGDIDLPLNKISAIAKALRTTPGELMGNTEDLAILAQEDGQKIVSKIIKEETLDIDFEDISVVYRNLNDDGRKRLSAYARELAKIAEYTK